MMDGLVGALRIAAQLAIIGLVWWVSDVVCRTLHLPVSSGVLGLFVMLALLAGGVIKLGMVERGVKWVLGELVFFFIPIMVSVLQYKDLLLSDGWKLLLTIAVGTALVMISTAVTMNMCYRWKRRLYKKYHS
ncbi:holin-like protein [Neisseria perflava]|nr:holin-like protein [Neisseria perflava]MCP1771368.1 holin-like protein [Neisseria perflava]